MNAACLLDSHRPPGQINSLPISLAVVTNPFTTRNKYHANLLPSAFSPPKSTSIKLQFHKLSPIHKQTTKMKTSVLALVAFAASFVVAGPMDLKSRDDDCQVSQFPGGDMCCMACGCPSPDQMSCRVCRMYLLRVPFAYTRYSCQSVCQGIEY